MKEPNSDNNLNRLIVRKRNVAGLELSEEVFPGVSSLPLHSHEHASFCIALQGSCTESFGKRKHHHQVSGFHFLAPDNQHSLKVHERGLRCFTVDIPADLMASSRDYFLSLETSINPKGGPAARLLMNLYVEFRHHDSASSIAIQGLVFEAMAEIVRRQTKSEETNHQLWLSQARDFLHAHFRESMNLKRIAREVGVHPAHLTRQFRGRYRYSPWEYVRLLRIDYACTQLRESERTLADISTATGFADQSHFGRTFKRFMGVTPAQYRARSSISLNSLSKEYLSEAGIHQDDQEYSVR